MNVRRLALRSVSLASLALAATALQPLSPASADLPVGCSQLEQTITCTYTANGSFTVPAGISSLGLFVVGGDGGTGYHQDFAGGDDIFAGTPGHGAGVTGPVPVGVNSVLTPGLVLTFTIGGNGSNANATPGTVPGGTGGGGDGDNFAGGGGGSTVLLGAPGPDQRLVVAAGGGGSAGNCPPTLLPCANGGDAGQNGQDGKKSGSVALEKVASGGLYTGPGGTGGISKNPVDSGLDGGTGNPVGPGGDGGLHGPAYLYTPGGGGGGAGYFGGGGGGGAAQNQTAGGGAGGLTYSAFNQTFVQTGDGNPRVVFTYTAPDLTDPVAAMTSAGAPNQLKRDFSLAWSGTDTGGSGITSYDVRYRKAAWNKPFGEFMLLANGTTTTTRGFRGDFGYQYCFSVRARDLQENESDWSAERCAALPLDDRTFSPSRGWTRATNSSYVATTMTVAYTKGRVLKREGAVAGRAALIVATGPGNGTIEVRYSGYLVKTISLASATTKSRLVIPLPTLTKPGTITIKTTQDKRAAIDGIVLARQ